MIKVLLFSWCSVQMEEWDALLFFSAIKKRNTINLNSGTSYGIYKDTFISSKAECNWMQELLIHGLCDDKRDIEHNTHRYPHTCRKEMNNSKGDTSVDSHWLFLIISLSHTYFERSAALRHTWLRLCVFLCRSLCLGLKLDPADLKQIRKLEPGQLAQEGTSSEHRWHVTPIHAYTHGKIHLYTTFAMMWVNPGARSGLGSWEQSMVKPVREGVVRKVNKGESKNEKSEWKLKIAVQH